VPHRLSNIEQAQLAHLQLGNYRYQTIRKRGKQL
jgi:hypothetical protein